MSISVSDAVLLALLTVAAGLIIWRWYVRRQYRAAEKRVLRLFLERRDDPEGGWLTDTQVADELKLSHRCVRVAFDCLKDQNFLEERRDRSSSIASLASYLNGTCRLWYNRRDAAEEKLAA
jgi:hypothetical protein